MSRTTIGARRWSVCATSTPHGFRLVMKVTRQLARCARRRRRNLDSGNTLWSRRAPAIMPPLRLAVAQFTPASASSVWIPRARFLFLTDLFYPEPEGRLHSFCHANEAHHLMGCILSDASCTTWFMDEVIRETDYGRSQRLTLVQFEPAPHCSYHIQTVCAR